MYYILSHIAREQWTPAVQWEFVISLLCIISESDATRSSRGVVMYRIILRTHKKVIKIDARIYY